MLEKICERSVQFVLNQSFNYTIAGRRKMKYKISKISRKLHDVYKSRLLLKTDIYAALPKNVKN